MLFEITGFLSGIAGVGVALWFLHRRDSSRVLSGIYGAGRGGAGA